MRNINMSSVNIKSTIPTRNLYNYRINRLFNNIYKSDICHTIFDRHRFSLKTPIRPQIDNVERMKPMRKEAVKTVNLIVLSKW